MLGHPLAWCLQLRKGTTLPDDAATWQAMLEDALPSAPKVR
jgi:hypothetical protein